MLMNAVDAVTECLAIVGMRIAFGADTTAAGKIATRWVAFSIGR
jgi:hypothetical protein